MASSLGMISDLYEYIKLELPGNPPDAVLQKAFRRAARNFCERTEAWVEELAAIDLVEDQETYTIESAKGATLWRIDKVYIRTEDDVTDGEDGTLQETSAYTFTQPDTFELVTPSTEDVTDGLVIHIVIVPPLDYDGDYDQWFIERWHEAFCDGAIAFLAQQPKKPWSSLEIAASYRDRFNRAISNARNEVGKAYVEKSVCITG